MRPALFMALARARLSGTRQFEVAAAAGIDPASLSRILNRERDPKPDEAAAIACVVEMGVEELFPELAERQAVP